MITKTKKEALRHLNYAVKKRAQFSDAFRCASESRKTVVFDLMVKHGRILHVCELLLEEYRRIDWAAAAFDDENGNADDIARDRCIDLSAQSIETLWNRLEWTKAARF